MREIFESSNFVTFTNMVNDEILYERVFNTIHVANAKNIKEVMAGLENYKQNLKFKKLSLEDALSTVFDSLVFNVTENCNLRCGYCIFSGLYEDARLHSKNKLDMDVAVRAIDFFIPKSKDRPYVLFYGGEPLLGKRTISEIVNYIKQNFPDKNSVFGLTTNFTLAERCLDFLIDNEFIITISLDGDKSIHDLWRKSIKGKGTFDKIYRNIEVLANTNYDYYVKNVGFSVTITDPSELLEIHDFFSAPLFENNAIRIQSVEKRFLKEDIFDYDERVNEGKRQLAYLAEKYAHNIISGRNNNAFLRGLFDGLVYPIYAKDTSLLPYELFARGMCKPGFRKLFVNTDGKYYMCEKIGSRLELGNVSDGFDFQKSVSAYNAYADIKNELCSSCWASRLCDSCAVSAKSLNAISVEGQMETCSSIKEKLLLGLSIYSYLLKNDKFKYYKNYYSEIKMEV